MDAYVFNGEALTSSHKECIFTKSDINVKDNNKELFVKYLQAKTVGTPKEGVIQGGCESKR